MSGRDGTGPMGLGAMTEKGLGPGYGIGCMRGFRAKRTSRKPT